MGLNKTHGDSLGRFYRIWSSILGRIYRKSDHNYSRYGAKGITVCKGWEEYLSFKKDMHESYLIHVKEYGEKQTQIDRIDYKLGYYKENCRWVTLKEQARNKSSNVFFTHNGETLSLAALVEKYGNGKKYGKIRQRIFRDGWSIEKALTTI